ncbi:MAG: TIGR00282 family metallophosphoesterase [Candidatus Moeniiplasma glomeromycotorum]|nr:TIGR00282 family metallophosphoesterase [Candidatus Moeniiplasma glomeromycotorum]MCE8169382.1 TIGR00282 family metallophosphoesterase [Candidatus Moeniiplasma glomeromycotorum]
MKILAIGDIFGKTGRQVIKKFLPQLKEKYQLDLVVANIENATHGKGISRKHYQELKEAGIGLMTSGNHIFALEETKKFIQEVPDLLRPLNSNPYHPGPGTVLLKIKGKKIRITNLLGTNFLPLATQNPYFTLEKLLNSPDWDIHLIDFHAETTAEKIALALYFDGKISALWGTHTHVQTADERILPNGTGFITDLGMTGPYSGVIGAKPEVIFQRAKYGLPAKMAPAEDNGQFNGVIFEFDDINNKVINVKRIKEIF